MKFKFMKIHNMISKIDIQCLDVNFTEKITKIVESLAKKKCIKFMNT